VIGFVIVGFLGRGKDDARVGEQLAATIVGGSR